MKVIKPFNIPVFSFEDLNSSIQDELIANECKRLVCFSEEELVKGALQESTEEQKKEIIEMKWLTKEELEACNFKRLTYEAFTTILSKTIEDMAIKCLKVKGYLYNANGVEYPVYSRDGQYYWKLTHEDSYEVTLEETSCIGNCHKCLSMYHGKKYPFLNELNDGDTLSILINEEEGYVKGIVNVANNGDIELDTDEYSSTLCSLLDHTIDVKLLDKAEVYDN